jgi:hypothetical protein
MIRPAEISKLAHRLGLGDKTIEKDYVLTWVLLAIAASPLRDLLAAFQPLPLRAASCVKALEDREGGYPALPLMDREIFIYRQFISGFSLPVY